MKHMKLLLLLPLISSVYCSSVAPESKQTFSNFLQVISSCMSSFADDSFNAIRPSREPILNWALSTYQTKLRWQSYYTYIQTVHLSAANSILCESSQCLDLCYHCLLWLVLDSCWVLQVSVLVLFCCCNNIENHFDEISVLV